MPRVSVYVPHELHSKLTRLKGRVNISELFQQALERALAADLAAPMDDRVARVVARLRRGDEAEAIFARGLEDGRRWAEDVASWDEILSVRGWTTQLLNAVTVADHEAFHGIQLLLGTDPLRWPPTATAVEQVLSGRLSYEEEAFVAYARGFHGGVRVVHEAIAPAMTLDARLAGLAGVIEVPQGERTAVAPLASTSDAGSRKESSTDRRRRPMVE